MVYLSHTWQSGFQVNSELLNGRNALHYAADYGQAEVISFLVKKGANVDVSNTSFSLSLSLVNKRTNIPRILKTCTILPC